MVRLAGVDASASALWRLGLAILPLALLARMTGGSLSALRGPLAGVMIGAGALYGLGTLVMNASALNTTLANCALIGNFSSFFVAGIALATARQKPSALAFAALSLSAAGLALLLGPSVALSQATIGGDLMALAAAVLFTGYFLLIMRVPRSMPPLFVHMVSTTAGAVVIAPFALQSAMIPDAWWPVAMLVGAQVVGQGLVVYAMPRVPPVLGGLCILLFPLINMMIGWAMYGEAMSVSQITGAVLVIGALALLQLRGRA